MIEQGPLLTMNAQPGVSGQGTQRIKISPCPRVLLRARSRSESRLELRCGGHRPGIWLARSIASLRPCALRLPIRYLGLDSGIQLPPKS